MLTILFILRRLAESIGVLIVVALIAFSMFQFVGDPVVNLVGLDATEQDIEKVRQQMGLDKPIVIQFGRFLGNLAQGEFGISYTYRRSAAEVIFEHLPATLELSLISMALALVVGIPLGIFVSLKRGSFLSSAVMSLSLLGVSLPTFLIGILLILIFGVELQWLPTFGRGEVVSIGYYTSGLFTRSGRLSLIMPAITLSLFQITMIMRLVRSEMLEVLKTDFIKFAKIRGLPFRSIYYNHALKNTLVPVVTITALQLGGIFAFAIITESVFQWPGMGLIFIKAVAEVDIPIMSAYLVMIALFFVLLNLLVDIMYFMIDPRLRRKN